MKRASYCIQFQLTFASLWRRWKAQTAWIRLKFFSPVKLSTLFEALITLHSRFTSCFYFSWVIAFKPLSACFFPEVILVFHSDLAVRTLLAQNIGERNFIPSFSERFQVYILSLLWEYPKLFIYSIRNMTSFLENPNLDQKVQEPLSFERRHKTIAPLLQLWE